MTIQKSEARLLSAPDGQSQRTAIRRSPDSHKQRRGFLELVEEGSQWGVPFGFAGILAELFRRILFPLQSLSVRQLFSMLTCYFDEAGGEDHGFIIVSGFVSTVAQWQQYEYDWKLMLAKYDVPYLHMKEISQFRGPFAKWKSAPGTRSQFLACASGIISDRAQHAFSHYVDCTAFGRLK
jgi:hypothetical protein